MENQKLLVFFFSQGGLDSLKRIFKLKAYTLEPKPDKMNFVGFIHMLLSERNQQREMLQEGLVKNNFARVIIKRINSHFERLFPSENHEEKGPNPALIEEREVGKEEEVSAEEYGWRIREVEEFTEMLVSLTENRSNRLYFREKAHLLTPIFGKFYQNLIQKYDVEHPVISSVLTLFSNLLVRESGVERNEIKDYLVKNYLPYFFSSIGLVLTRKENKFITLKRSALGFLSNLLIYKKAREFVQTGVIDSFGKDNKV